MSARKTFFWGFPMCWQLNMRIEKKNKHCEIGAFCLEMLWTVGISHKHQNHGFLRLKRIWPKTCLEQVCESNSKTRGFDHEQWGFNQRNKPKEYPNSQKQKQLTNRQWVKYVYSPALLTLEAGRAGRNHSTNALWDPLFQKRLQLWQLKGPVFPKLVWRVFPTELLPTSFFTSST